MGKVFLWVAACVLAVAVGVGSAFVMIRQGGPTGALIHNGSWETARFAGDPASDPYTRARIAIYGLWALPPSEVVYFTALNDQDKRPLSRNCNYEVRGGALPTRWWSLALYRDFFFIENPKDRFSWSSTSIGVPPGEPWTVQVNAAGQGPRALPMGDKDGRFVLSLRLYQPHPGVLDQRDTIPLPQIVRLSCAGASA